MLSQVSEDHCWLQLGAGQRETTIEVTTDTAAKRGLPVAPDAWRGWLYTGGHAVLCSPHQALAALVTSINPSVTGGKKGVSVGLHLGKSRLPRLKGVGYVSSWAAGRKVQVQEDAASSDVLFEQQRLTRLPSTAQVDS